MVKRIVAAGIVVLALMIAVKDGRVLRDAGLTGVCSLALTLNDGTHVEACHSGRLAGRPDLSRDGCSTAGLRGAVEYWRCPAGVAAGPSGH